MIFVPTASAGLTAFTLMEGTVEVFIFQLPERFSGIVSERIVAAYEGILHNFEHAMVIASNVLLHQLPLEVRGLTIANDWVSGKIEKKILI